jgi:hypothetical protein
VAAKVNEMTNSNNQTRPVVKGDRICLKCKGICHEDSVRSKSYGHGTRSHYFCGFGCLKRYYAHKFYDEYEAIMERQGRMDEFEAKMIEVAQERLDSGAYEYVDCITL